MGWAQERSSPAMLDVGIPCFLSRCSSCPRASVGDTSSWPGSLTSSSSATAVPPPKCRTTIAASAELPGLLCNRSGQPQRGDRRAPRFCSTAPETSCSIVSLDTVRCARRRVPSGSDRSNSGCCSAKPRHRSWFLFLLELMGRRALRLSR